MALTEIGLLEAIPIRVNCSSEKLLNSNKLECLTAENSVNKFLNTSTICHRCFLHNHFLQILVMEFCHFWKFARLCMQKYVRHQ